ncbi:MAG TPA: signal recognition particle-docking protein FtsY [Gammaproteobacteria bacterium]|nr:signal recognition particle-docking protein FtsY [Gammaproteobacteria bacterium]
MTSLTGHLARLRSNLTALFSAPRFDAQHIEELEAQLLRADVGVEATQRLVEALDAARRRGELADAAAARARLTGLVHELLAPCAKPLVIAPPAPFVMLVVGVNGTGKTTTIGRLAHRFRREGRSVLVAAADTFRAAAAEQLEAWARRAGAAFIAQQPGTDPAAVAYDAFHAARARGTEVLIVDTAGRLHTRTGLMEELAKIRRVLARCDAAAPHETLLVLDAGGGQNALAQAREFHDRIGVTGVVLTKLDGTAKGGMLIAIAQTLRLPIRFVGVGEGPDDLVPFDAQEYAAALLAPEN